MNDDERRVRIAEVSVYLDHLDRLLCDDPKMASAAAVVLPALVNGLDRDIQARGYACLGLAQVKSGLQPPGISPSPAITSMVVMLKRF